MSMQSMAVGRVPAWSLRNRLPVILRGWRLWLLLASVALGAGLAWQWRWLAAIGVLPFLLSAAPCAAMCAFGLCASKLAGGSCKSGSTTGNLSDVVTQHRAAQDGSPDRMICN